MGISRIDTYGKYKEDVVKVIEVFGIVVRSPSPLTMQKTRRGWGTSSERMMHPMGHGNMPGRPPLEQAMDTRNVSLGEDFQLLSLNMHGKRKLKSRL
jgi:hypothetical protein